MDIEMLEDKAFSLRKQIMEVGYKTQSGHLSSALSVVEIMTVLYYAGFLGIDKSNHQNIYRNRFVLSKGHACIIQYLILADLGIIEKKHLWNFCKPTGILGAHPDCLKIAGIDATTGSLGHGLSFAIGTALAAKKMGTEFMTYVVLGDGECQEGSIWEAALCAGNKALDNLVVIIDYNKLQASDYVDNISSLEPLADKWKAFGFYCYEIDGNDIKQVYDTLSMARDNKNGKPKAIVANTYKGKGVSIMENRNGWHGRKPNANEWISVCAELGISEV